MVSFEDFLVVMRVPKIKYCQIYKKLPVATYTTFSRNLIGPIKGKWTN